MKRIVSMLLVFVMIFSLFVPTYASAADDTEMFSDEIVIDNDVEVVQEAEVAEAAPEPEPIVEAAEEPEPIPEPEPTEEVQAVVEDTPAPVEQAEEEVLPVYINELTVDNSEQKNANALLVLEAYTEYQFSDKAQWFVEEYLGQEREWLAEDINNFEEDFDVDVVLPFWVAVFDEHGAEVKTLGTTNYYLTTNYINAIEETELLHQKENGDWEVLNFDIVKPQDGTPSYAEFDCKEFGNFAFVVLNEKAEEEAEEVVEEPASEDVESSDGDTVMSEEPTEGQDSSDVFFMEEDEENKGDVVDTSDAENASGTDSTAVEEVDADEVNDSQADDSTSEEEDSQEGDAEKTDVVETEGKGEDEAALNGEEVVSDADEMDDEENAENSEEVEEDAASAEMQVEDEVAQSSEKLYKYSDDDVYIEVLVSGENALSDEAELVVSKIDENSDLYAEYVQVIAEMYNAEEADVEIFPYDIHFEVDGEEVEPSDAVISVSFELKEEIVAEDEDLTPLVHIKDDGTAEELVEVLADDEDVIKEFQFEIESFSSIVISKIRKAPATDTTKKYAILYSNGDLVFQQGNETDESKGEVVTSWTDFDGTAQHPWSGRSDVTHIVFNTVIAPNNCSSYFSSMAKLKTIENLENLDVSGVAQFGYMFSQCSSLTEIDLSTWDMTSAVSVNYMFDRCQSLQYVDMDACNLSNVTDAKYMFYNCTSLRTVKSTNWGLESLDDAERMFDKCYDLSSIDVEAWNPTKLHYAPHMFSDCRRLTYLDLSNWQCSDLYGTISMFSACSRLETLLAPNWSWRGNIQYSWYAMFDGCTNLSALDISGWNLAKRASSRTWESMFNNTKALGYIDLSGWDNSSGNSIKGMFSGSGVSRITLGENFRFAGGSGTSYQLPSGTWMRESTGDLYTAAELAAAWNSTMADTYRKVTVVSFDGNGGNASKRKMVVNLGESIEELPDATRDGYTFLGWFTSSTGGTQLNEGDPITQIKYYAHWQENTYTLILKRNVEDDPDDTEVRIELPYTEIYTLDPAIFENDDKVLQGWTLNNEGTGRLYGPDERVVMLSKEPNGIFTLYAKWGRTRNATVEFDSQGGSEVENIVIERGQTIDMKTYQTPYREGYSFRGWYTQPNGAGTRYDNANRTINNSMTLYANWVKDPVVSFNPNGGWVETFTRTVPYGTAIGNLPASDNRPEKLIGFFTSQTPGEGTKLTESTVFTSDATYWAHWGYQPFFNAAGGKFTSFDLNATYPVDYPAEQEIHTLPTVVRDGYEFVRWELADGTEVHEGDIVNLDVFPEIIAVWQKEDMATVTFNVNGGTMPSGQTTKYDIKKGTALNYYPNPTRTISGRRADFLGWYDEEDNLVTSDTIINEDMVLTAKWAENKYKLTFVPDGGGNVASVNGSGVNTRYLSEGEALGTVPGTKRDNYVFEGWYSEPNGEGTKLTAETTVTEDTTWYAHWVDNHNDKVSDDVAYKFWAEWSNASNDNVDNVDNNLEFHPTSNNTQTASLHLHFELNSQVSNVLPTGSVRIRIPQYIWKNWTGSNTGTNNLSSQMSEFPKIASGMWFSYYKDGEDYVLVNNQPLAGGAGIDMTISYQVTPSDVPGGAMDSNGTYLEDYDYYSGNVPVEFYIDKEFEIEDGKTVQTSAYDPETEETVDLSVEMHTRVNQTINKSFNSLYYEWNSSWGTKPADADDYFYIMWRTTTTANSVSQPYKYIVDENTIHDGTVVYGQSSTMATWSTNSGSNNYLYTVTKHPKELLQDIPASGIQFTNESKRTTTWRSGYEETVAAKATYTLREWEYTKGEFDKTNTTSSVRTISGGQENLLDNMDVPMTWELHYDGVSRDTPLVWHEDTNTYEAQQRVIAIADGVNGDLFYSSGSPNAKYVWQPTTGNYTLEDDDYTIKTLRIITREYDGSYFSNQWGGPTVNNEVSKWKDLDIYVRYKDTDELVYWKSVRPQNGTQVTVTLPNNVNGYEVRYPTSYYRTYLQVYMDVLLHPTANIRSLVYADTSEAVTSIIKNRGYCNIWTSDEWWTNPDTKDVMYGTHSWTKDTHTDSDIFFHVTDWTGGMNGANKEIYELNKSYVYLYAQKFSAAQTQVLFDVERGYQENPMAIRGWTYASSGNTKYVKNGVFYDLLPRGATVPEDSIFGVLTAYNQNGTTSTNIADSYSSAKNNTSTHLAREYYDVRFEDNWENSGRTMMTIRFMVPENQSRNMATFYYLLHMTYADVVNYGTAVENDVAFVDESVRDYDYYQSYNSVNVITEREFYELINLENDWVSHSAADTHYIPVDAFSWGFDKSVKTKTEYVNSDVTIPNNEYTYRLTFSQSDYATSDSVVFYDVLETGAVDNEGELEKESEWYGYFESIDVSSIRTKLKKDTEDVYCEPVVYYSTKARDAFTGSDYDVTNTETWTTEQPVDKTTITAVAVDCRMASDGTEFVQSGRQSMSVYITMRAPVGDEYIGKSAVNQAKLIARIYDEEPPEEPSEATSDTEVTLEDEEPEIHKTSDPESGTEDEPTVVSYGEDMTYTITVTNKNETFTVTDYVVEDDMPEGVQVKTSDIKVHFGNAANAASVSVSPRISMRARGNKLTFTISSLIAGETAYIIVPVKVIARGDDDPIHNQAKITSVNGVDKEIVSEDTWHEVQYDVVFSKQSDRKQLVVGAHLQLFDANTEELIEEWDTTKANKTIRLYIGNFILKETSAPSGYALAEDIHFTVEPDGTITYADETTDTKVVMVDVASTEVKGQKHWKWDTEDDRPESITVVLQQNGEDYREVEVTAANDWNYDFGKVPKYDSLGNEYHYTVIERDVPGYSPAFSEAKETNSLEITFSTKTQTYNADDYFEVYYNYDGKMFRVGKYYGAIGSTTNPGGTSIIVPTDNFYVYWHSNNSGNGYGFKIDSIMPVVASERVGTRMNLPTGFTVEEVTGNKYPETDHEYFINEDIFWHYSRDMEGDILDIVNTKISDTWDIDIHKINENGDLMGGVELTLMSDPELGDDVIEPISWTTVEGEVYTVSLKPGTYVLHEEATIEGYQLAEDVKFQVNQNGQVLIGDGIYNYVEMVNKTIEQPYPFRKVWMDDGFESLRPESVTFELVRSSDDEVVATTQMTADNAVDDTVWEGFFENVPAIDEERNPIDYYVREVVDNQSYRVYYDTQEKNGFLVTFTDDSDIGDGRMYIYVLSHNPEYYTGYTVTGELVLNEHYGFNYAEGTDMAGKTYYVPIVDGAEAFMITRSWASNSVKLEIASIIPTSEVRDVPVYSTYTGLSTNVFTGKNYPNLNSDGVQSAVYQWNATTNAEDSEIRSELINYVNKTNVPVRKFWNDNGYENERPSTLTFDLYNVEDMDNPVSSITVDTRNGEFAEYVFENVPKYNDDWSLAQYVVRERSVAHYKTDYSVRNPQGFLVTFSEDSFVGSDTGCLAIYSRDGNKLNYYRAIVDTNNGGLTVETLKGTEMAGKTYYVQALDETHPGFAIYVYDNGKTSHVKVDSVIPVDYTISATNISSGTSTDYGMPIDYVQQIVSGDEYPEINMETAYNTYRYVLYNYEYRNQVYNTTEYTSVPVTKLWADDGNEELRPEEITISVYNVNTPETVVDTITLTADDAVGEDEWVGVVKHLPKYNDDGSLAQYAIRESEVTNYHAFYGKPKGMLITFTEDSYAGYPNNTNYIMLASVNLAGGGHCVSYIAPDGSTTGPSSYGFRVTGNTYYVPIERDGDYAFAILNNDARSHIEIESVVLTSEEYPITKSNMGMYLDSNIPQERRYEGTGSYDISGAGGWYLYTYTGATGDQIGSGAGTVLNKVDITELPVTKIWADTGYEDQRPESVTINAYNERDKETIVGSVTLTSDNETADYQWNGTIRNLPKYNSDGTEAKYVLKEQPVENYYTAYDKPKGMIVTLSSTSHVAPYSSGSIMLAAISRRSESTTRYVMPLGHSSTSIADSEFDTYSRQFYIPIEEEGVYEFAICNANSDHAELKIESVELTTEEREISYSGYTMPISTISTAYRYEGSGSYDLTGKAGWNLYTYTGADASLTVPSDSAINNTITNQINNIDIPFTKTWVDAGFEERRPESLTFNLYNERDMETIVASATLQAEDFDGTTWEGTFSDVPKYNEDGTQAVYVVKEATVPSDYTEYASVKGIKGFLLTFSEDTDLTNGSLYIWQSDGQNGRNYVTPASSYASYYTNYTPNTPIAGKTVFVPVYQEGVYEFCVQLTRSSSATPHYTIDSIVPVYEEKECNIYTGPTVSKAYVHNPSYPNYEEVTNVSSLSRSFANSAYGTNTSLYTWVKWNVDDATDHGVLNTLDTHYIQFNKYSNVYNKLPGATLQLLKASDNSVITEWVTDINDFEYALPAGEYILHEVEPAVGFETADDIRFTVNGNGTVTIQNDADDEEGGEEVALLEESNLVRMFDNELVTVKGTKTWENDNEAQRPESIAISLMRNGTVIDTKEVTAKDDWSWEFSDLPKYVDDTSTRYVYTVSESTVHDYHEQVQAPVLTDSWVSGQTGWDVEGVTDSVITPRTTTVTERVSVPVQGLAINFNSSFNVESTTYDWLYIYYRKNGTMYRLTPKYGGGNSLANATVYVPSNDVYFVWRTDSSVSYYGWAISSITPLTYTPSVSSVTDSLPTKDGNYSYSTTNYSGTNYPQTSHNYGHNERKIYHYTGASYTTTTQTKTVTTYDVSSTKGLKLKFSDSSCTEGADYITVVFKANGQYYRMKDTVSGNLSGREIIVPSTDVYLVWCSNSSVVFYGWDIVDVTEVDNVTAEECNTYSLYEGFPTYDYTNGNYPSTSHPYTNGEYVYYHISTATADLPDVEDRVASTVTANITNTRLPDKIDASVYKQNPEGGNIPGAVLQITGHETNASYDIDPIEWTTSVDAPEVIPLRQGEYVLHEVSVPSGYLRTNDIAFTINENNEIVVNGEVVDAITMVDNHNLRNVPFEKYWNDAGYEQYRPESITFDLYDVLDMDTVVQSQTTSAPNWSGEFTDVPIVHEDDETVIEYTVVERPVQYYSTTMSGDDSANLVEVPDTITWTPHYGMKITTASTLSTSGPLLLIWKDNVSGNWYSNSWGMGSSSTYYLPASEAYLLYRSYGSNNGINISSIEPHTQSMGTTCNMGGGWVASTFEEAYRLAREKSFTVGSVNYGTTYFPETISKNDYVDGSNGYYESVASENYSAEPVYQAIKLKLPDPEPITIAAHSASEFANADGIALDFGDDVVRGWGTTTILWKEDGVFKMRGNSAWTGTQYIKSKEVYVFFSGTGGVPSATNSYSATATGLSVKNIRPVTGNYAWMEGNATNYKSVEEYRATLKSYDGSTNYTDYPILDGRGGISLENTYSRPQQYSLIYEAPQNAEDGLLVTFANTQSYGPLCIWYKVNGIWEPHYYGNFGGNAAGNTYYIPAKEFYIVYTDYNGNPDGADIPYGFQIINIQEGSSGTLLSEDSAGVVTLSDIASNFTVSGSGPLAWGWSTAERQEFENDDYPSYVSYNNSNNGKSVICHYIAPNMFAFTNTFVVRQFDVPFNKVNASGSKIGGAHLELWRDGGKVKEWTTVEGETHIETLDHGTYTLKETNVPDGYVKGADVTFTLTPIGEILLGGTEVQSISMTDADTVVRVLKQTDDEEALAGAELQLLNFDGEEVETWTSTATAKEFRNLPAGSYTVHEVTPPDGYLPSEDITFVLSDEDGSVKVNGTAVDVVTMTDTTIYVHGRKFDDRGNLLEGAELSIYEADGKTLVDSFETTEEAWTYGPIAVGSYVLKETHTVDGFTYARDIPFTVNENGTSSVGGEVVEFIDVVNTPTEVIIRKVDIANELLPGAKMQILDDAGNVVVDEWTTGDDADVFIGRLNVDTEYVLHEVEAPENYTLSEDIQFTIGFDGTVYVDDEAVDAITMIDHAFYSLTVSKTVTGSMGSRVTDFHFEVEFSQNNSALIPETITATKANGDGETQTLTLTVDEDGVAQFTLRHDETIVLTGIPEGMGYEISELDGRSAGYKVKATNAKGEMTENQTSAFENKRDAGVPTNVEIATPMIAIVLLAAGTIGVLLLKKKHKA